MPLLGMSARSKTPGCSRISSYHQLVPAFWTPTPMKSGGPTTSPGSGRRRSEVESGLPRRVVAAGMEQRPSGRSAGGRGTPPDELGRSHRIRLPHRAAAEPGGRPPPGSRPGTPPCALHAIDRATGSRPAAVRRHTVPATSDDRSADRPSSSSASAFGHHLDDAGARDEPGHDQGPRARQRGQVSRGHPRQAPPRSLPVPRTGQRAASYRRLWEWILSGGPEGWRSHQARRILGPGATDPDLRGGWT